MGIISSIIDAGSQAADTTANLAWQQLENKKNRNFNAEQAALDRDFQSVEAQKQRDYEERMSNTAYQRAMNDMQAAGVNPAMAFSGGSAQASTPSGASAKGSSASYSTGLHSAGNLFGGIADIVRAFNYDKNRANDVHPKNLSKNFKSLVQLLKDRPTNISYKKTSLKDYF